MHSTHRKITERKKDIAIIGMSGKFHQSPDITTFWKNLVEGVEMVQFYDDEELERMGVTKSLLSQDNYVRLRADIEGSEYFDYAFFGYTKSEAEMMDPQIRLMHELVWNALEDSGCDPDSYKGKIGLYLSASDNLNWRANALANPNPQVSPFMAARLADKSFMNTLISYSLNLRGPSYTVDTACSSALASVHFACRNLLMKECSVAIAGGVRINTNKTPGYLYEEGMILSKDGHCRTFDEQASGTILADGAGVVVLRRYEDALNDKDPIYAVIRSSAVNNDGSRKVGYTAPSIVGQYECIKLAHRVAGISPSAISYVEAHGTGTHMGDPVEVEALNKAFNHNTTQRCALGSVKSNLGHLDAAAGIVGLIKTTLALKHQILPASLHVDKPNPEINFEDGPFYVNTSLAKWKRQPDQLLAAGVSSFGIGGTNVHVVLEEAPAQISEEAITTQYQILLLSAKTPDSLKKGALRLEPFIEKMPEQNLPALAYTLSTGRKHFEYRKYLVCKDKQEALAMVKDFGKGAMPIRKTNCRVVFMFSGQGSQYFEMGKSLYVHEPYFRSIVDQGLDYLNATTGEDYSQVIGYVKHGQSDEQKINDTRYAQPLIFIIEYALARMLMHLGICPSNMIGHSLGEYVAACVAGVFSFEDALNIIVKRAGLMASLPEGSMLSIGVALEAVQAYLPQSLSVAVVNTGQSVVVSGSDESIVDCTEALMAAGMPYAILKTSHAFHSSMMDSILAEFEAIVSAATLSVPQHPFVSNLTGKPIKPEEATSAQYWARHLRETVWFADGLTYLLKQKYEAYIEIGPGKSLTGFLRQNEHYIPEYLSVNLLKHPKETIDGQKLYFQAVGKLWEKGLKVDWPVFYKDRTTQKIPAPGYAFDQNSLPVRVDPFAQINRKEARVEHPKQQAGHSFCYLMNWKKTLQYTKPIDDRSSSAYLIFTHGGKLIETIEKKLSETGKLVIYVNVAETFAQTNPLGYAINPNKAEDYDKLFANLAAKQYGFDRIILNWDFGIDDDLVTCLPLMILFERLANCHLSENTCIAYINAFNNQVLGDERTNIPMSVGRALTKTIIKSTETYSILSIDVAQSQHSSELATSIIQDMESVTKDSVIAYRNGIRWERFFDRERAVSENKDIQDKKNKTYVIINGLGGPWEEFAILLSQTDQAKVAMIGLEQVSHEKQLSLKQAGTQIQYYQVDTRDKIALRQAIKDLESEYGDIEGVICAPEAQVSDDKRANMSFMEWIEKRERPTISTISNLYHLNKDMKFGFVWLPLSLSSLLGSMKDGVNVIPDTYAALCKMRDYPVNDYWLPVYIEGLHQEVLTGEELMQVFKNSLVKQVVGPMIYASGEIEGYSSRHATKTNQVHVKEAHSVERPISDTPYCPPQNDIEEALCQMWQSFFGITQVGIEDDFFELGGDSLRASTLLRRVQKHFSIEISLKDFYDKATVKLLAQEISLAQMLIKAQKTKNSTKAIKI